MKEDTRDKEWSYLHRASAAYYQDVNSVLDFAFDNVSTTSGKILCPCTKCVTFLFQNRDIVEEHLVRRGFASHYRIWTEHGEVESEANRAPNDDVHNEDAMNKVDAKVNLIPELCTSKWSYKSFDKLIASLEAILPIDEKLPNNFYKINKMTDDL
ncbi:hypothetical protein RJ639_025844 [Escallonia herrerae]|uniref:Transposase-associated domain-containing protein n=1 Tax=Escallonia herrerae TaxID=1293975 RepID=A0AA88UX15_9ASTE|nr:hypothetical protein RJ639_025844 [Escallonia herrerae]